jgi:hypothetical protein
LTGFSFLSEAKDVLTKTTHLAMGKGQRGIFNLHAKNKTNFNNMDRQSVDKENLCNFHG